MEWTREKTLTLIEEYRKRPGLWDMRHEDYRKKDIKKELLEQVAQAFSRAFPPVEIEKKFHTLRTQYHREINRMNQLRSNSEPYKSKWFAFQHLGFLSSPNACRASRSTTVKIKIEKTEDQSTGAVTMGDEEVEDDDDNTYEHEPPTKYLIKTLPVSVHAATYTATPISTSHTNATEYITASPPPPTSSQEQQHHANHSNNNNNKGNSVLVGTTSNTGHHIEIEGTALAVTKTPSSSSSTVSTSTSTKSRGKEIRRITRKELQSLIDDATKNVDEPSESEPEQPPQTQQTRVIINEVNIASGAYNNHQVTLSEHHRIIQTGANTFEAQPQNDEVIEVTHDASNSVVEVQDNSYDQQSYHNVHNQIKITPLKISSISHQQQNHQHQQQRQQQQKQQRVISAISSTDPIFGEEVVFDEQQQQQQQQNQQTSEFTKKYYYEKIAVRDEFTIFGEYVANELRFISNRDALVTAKHKINVALFEAQTNHSN